MTSIGRYRGKRFLVLDAHRVLQGMLGPHLRRLGAEQVVFAADAGTWLAALADPFDVLVADWDLPEQPGLDLVHRLRTAAVNRGAALLLFAARITPEMEALREPYDIAAFIPKPFQVRQVIDAVDAVLRARESPSEFDLLLRRGLGLLEQGVFDKALLVYNWLRQVAPGSLAALFGAGEAMSGQGRHDDARAVFEEVVARSPLFLKGYLRLVDLAEGRDDREEVFRLLQEVATLSPTVPDPHVRMARQHHRAGELAAAERSLRHALALDPARWEASLILTDVLLSQDRLPEAAALVDEARQHHPGQIDLFNNLGIALRRRGRLREAEQTYAAALAVRPDHPVLLYNAGVVQFLMGADTEARRLLDEALARQPDLASARQLRAVLERPPPVAERAPLFR